MNLTRLNLPGLDGMQAGVLLQEPPTVLYEQSFYKDAIIPKTV